MSCWNCLKNYLLACDAHFYIFHKTDFCEKNADYLYIFANFAKI